jgi:hypothetical protein
MANEGPIASDAAPGSAPTQLIPNWPFVAAALLTAMSFLLFYPGIVGQDAFLQYQQGLENRFTDWHPPIMARLWQALHLLIGGRAEPMLALQMLLYWSGAGLFAAGLAGRGNPGRAKAVLAVAASPFFLGWQAAILKDTQMLAALSAATGLIAFWRLRGLCEPGSVWFAVVPLLLYVTLLRANAVFVTVPLTVLLLPWPAPGRIIGGLVATALFLAVAPGINHGVFGAERTGVEKDLIVRERCYKPFFWDPLAQMFRCGSLLDRALKSPDRHLPAAAARAVLTHPFAYAQHRLEHLNQTMRWIVPRNLGAGWPGFDSYPNELGVGGPGPLARFPLQFTIWMAESPFGWPILWVALALTGLAALHRAPPGPRRGLAVAMLGSAVALEASFVLISIASDLRYHLWPMFATALALLTVERVDRRTLTIGGTVFAVLLVSAVGARAVLPLGPRTYQEAIW